MAAQLKRLRTRVCEAATVKDTAFFRDRAPSIYRHGQRRGASHERHKTDNHYSVLRPSAYIELRIKPLISFYQARLPRYYRARAALQAAQLLSSALIVLLAAFGFSRFCGIVTVVISSLGAWGEFYGAGKKLVRYSTVINALKDEILLWDSLTEVERHATESVEQLVGRCEDLIAGERDGWLSTSQAAKMLAKATGADDAHKEE